MVIHVDTRLQPDEYPRRFSVGGRTNPVMYEMQPGEVLLQFKPEVDDDRIEAFIAQQDFKAPAGDQLGVDERHLRIAKMRRVTVPQLAGLSDAWGAFDWARDLVAQHPDDLQMASPVFHLEGQSAETAAVPVYDRLIVRAPDQESSARVQDWSRRNNSPMRDIVNEIVVEWSERDLVGHERGRQHRARMLNDAPTILVLEDREQRIDPLRLVVAADRGEVDELAGLSVEIDWRKLSTWERARPAEWSAQTFWNLERVKALDAWQIERGQPEVIVALLDSGFDLTHRELTDSFSGPALHFNTEEWADLNGPLRGTTFSAAATGDDHGTLVTGVVAASHDVGDGALGLAPDVRIMPIRLGAVPSAFEIGVGLLWACARGAAVANLSFETTPLEADFEILSLVWNAGMVLCAAAGNRGTAAGPSEVSFPASHPNVIAVGASDQSDLRKTPAPGSTWGSQFGNALDVVAPGVECTSTVPAGTGSGAYLDILQDAAATSIAAPHVSALAALLLSHQPLLSNRLARSAIESTCDLANVYVAGARQQSKERPWAWHPEVGFGRINCLAALMWVESLTAEQLAEGKDATEMADKDSLAQAKERLDNLLQDKAVFPPDDQADLDIIDAANREGTGLRALHGVAVRALAESAAPGGSKTYSKIRLYVDVDFNSWVDVRADDVRVLRRYALDDRPFGRVFLLVTAGAQLQFAQNESVESFLQGRITDSVGDAPRRDDGLTEMLALLRQLAGSGGLGGYSTGRGPC